MMKTNSSDTNTVPSAQAPTLSLSTPTVVVIALVAGIALEVLVRPSHHHHHPACPLHTPATSPEDTTSEYKYDLDLTFRYFIFRSVLKFLRNSKHITILWGFLFGILASAFMFSNLQRATKS